MRKLLLALALSLAYATTVHAQITTPYTFTVNTVANPDEVNANFAKFADALNRTGGTMTGTLTSRSVVPSATNTYDLGSAAAMFQTGYLRTSAVLGQTTANYTLTWANPAAARAISIADPGGTDVFTFNAATQTLTNKTVALGSNTVSGTLAQFNTALTDDNFAGLGAANTFTNGTQTIDSATNALLVLDRGTTGHFAALDLKTAGVTKFFVGLDDDGSDTFAVMNSAGTAQFSISPTITRFYGPDAVANRFKFISGLAAVLNGSELAGLDFESSDGSADGTGVVAQIYTQAAAAFTGGTRSTDLVFATASGTAVDEKMRLSSAGLLTVSGDGTHTFGSGTSGTTILSLNGQSAANVGAALRIAKGGVVTGYVAHESVVAGGGSTSSNIVLMGEGGQGVALFVDGNLTKGFRINTDSDWLRGSSIMDSVGTPTINAGFCAGATIAGTDYAFIIDTGNCATAQGTVDFGHTWTTDPVCVATMKDSPSGLGVWMNSTTTTAVTITHTAAGGGATRIYVLCRGY